jgi:putative membrane protein
VTPQADDRGWRTVDASPIHVVAPELNPADFLPDRWQDLEAMGPFLIRAALTGLALWIVTLFVHGMSFVGGDTKLQRVGIIFVVAVIFGLVNAFIKPIVQILSIPLYILTLGLIHIVINALMLWITAWITEHTTHWGLAIDHFWWTAIWAAIVLSIVSWVLSLVVRRTRA